MNAIVDFSAEPQMAGQDLIPAGAAVVAHYMDGSVDKGQLQSISVPHSAVVVLRASGEASIIPLPKLRYLAFSKPLIPVDEPHSGDRRGEEVVMPGPGQEFRVDFSDGKFLQGRTRGSLSDAMALHLFLEQERGLVRLFIPVEVVKEFQVGTLLLSRQDIITRTLAGPAVRQSMAAGAGRLPQQISGSVEELHHVLDHKSHVTPKALGQLLLEEDLVTPEQLRAALAVHQQSGQRLGEVLEKAGVISSEMLLRVLAHKLGMPFVRLRGFDVDPVAVKLLPAAFARKYRVMPLCIHKDRLVVTTGDPTSHEAPNALHFVTGRNIEMAVAATDDIDEAIERYYGDPEAEEAVEVMEDSARVEEEQDASAAERLAQEKPMVKLVQNILLDAIRRGASDIHIRPGESSVELLFRIDGTMVKIRSFSKSLLKAVVSRIKILGRMNISEHRVPQDGRARLVGNGKTVDLRISVMPMVTGESVVIRILNAQAALKGIDELGFEQRNRDVFVDLLHKSYGIILVTGPTGSGKSTTLYAALNALRQQNHNIITVEDPVEYHMDSIEQAQVNIPAGYTFARALRNILRHDPDAIMIGEIRDEETARIAVESSLTGHLVLSTLHTNSAAATVSRLLQMGIEPYLVNSAVQGVLAQRLVRKNCPKCTEEEEVQPAVRKVLGVAEDEVFYRGKGCDHCNHTGYQGRMAVYELMTMTRGLRERIAPGVNIDDIQEQAVKDGMIPLMQNALVAARERKTSLAEVYRVRLE